MYDNGEVAMVVFFTALVTFIIMTIVIDAYAECWFRDQILRFGEVVIRNNYKVVGHLEKNVGTDAAATVPKQWAPINNVSTNVILHSGDMQINKEIK